MRVTVLDYTASGEHKVKIVGVIISPYAVSLMGIPTHAPAIVTLELIISC